MKKLLSVCIVFILALVLVGGCKLTGLDVKVDELDTNEVVTKTE